MKAKRRRHDTAFKARVALEALKGQKTTQQITGTGNTRICCGIGP